MIRDLLDDFMEVINDQRNLRKSCPVIKDGFTIKFDYAADRFIVALSPPKEENKVKFTNWLKTSYSAIPLERFIFN